MAVKALTPLSLSILRMPHAPEGRAKHTRPMLPGIVVLNYKYFPDTPYGPSKVGATAFAMSAVQVLRDIGLFCGALLYKRQEALQQPVITIEVRNSMMCAVLEFNFEMGITLLQQAISTISELLASDFNCPPMLYYQTDTLLEYHPKHLPLCVTHHGPFYEDFLSRFSNDLAGVAFGSHQKAQHLHKHQSLGIEQLKMRDNAFVFQHSQLQGQFLLESGIDAAKMFGLCPPIHSMRVTDYPKLIDATLRNAVRGNGTLLFTAVARLDYFKNIELLVDAAIELLQRSQSVTVLIAGDDVGDDYRRIKLLERIPKSYRWHFKIVPKLRKDTLYSLFEHTRHNGIFVCPSRYETLGITPLEAGLSGVTTVISDSSQVEAKRFFPERYRFLPTAIDLATLLRSFQGLCLDQCGKRLNQHLEKRISHEGFKSNFLHAWQQCSQSFGVFSSP